MSRLESKPRGLLRDAFLVLSLVLFTPNVVLMSAGAALFLMGAVLHLWAKGCLVRNSTVTACGPYRLVRHPFYLANFLIDFGFCLASGRIWLVALYVVAFGLVYLPTIRREELFLTEEHGEAYSSYRASTPALLPYRLHALIGTLDASWENIKREKELARLFRILAIPAYFLIVATLFHSFPADRLANIIVLSVSVALAIGLNGASVALRR